MKQFLNSATLMIILMFSTLAFAQQPEVQAVIVQQQDSMSFLDKVEGSSVSTIDSFLTKYEPKVSNQLGKLWEFTKSTTSSLYKAFVRYLIVKDTFPIAIGAVLIWLAFVLSKRLRKITDKADVIFPQIPEKETFTEYESIMVKKDNQRNTIYDIILKAFADNVFYIALIYILWQLVPYFYSLALLIIAPEARVLLEVTNLYKSF